MFPKNLLKSIFYLVEVFSDNSAKTLNFCTNTFEILLKKIGEVVQILKKYLDVFGKISPSFRHNSGFCCFSGFLVTKTGFLIKEKQGTVKKLSLYLCRKLGMKKIMKKRTKGILKIAGIIFRLIDCFNSDSNNSCYKFCVYSFQVNSGSLENC